MSAAQRKATLPKGYVSGDFFFLKNMQCNTLKFTDFIRCDKEFYNALQLFGAVKLHSLLSYCHWHFNSCLGNGINASHR